MFPIFNCTDPSRNISHQKILWRCSLRCFEFCQNCYEIVQLSPHYWSLTYMYLLKLTHFWILCKKCIVKFSQFKAKIYKKYVCRKYLTNSLHECHERTDLVKWQFCFSCSLNLSISIVVLQDFLPQAGKSPNKDNSNSILSFLLS